jgi:hypothetical protein
MMCSKGDTFTLETCASRISNSLAESWIATTFISVLGKYYIRSVVEGRSATVPVAEWVEQVGATAYW